MADLLLVVVTAVLSAALTGAVLYWLWSRRVMPVLEDRARTVAEEVTADAVVRLREEALRTGDDLAPKFRQAMRDGIQDAVFAPPTERIGQTARGVTNAGVNVMDAAFRRLFGSPADPSPRPERTDRTDRPDR
ncbi:hypothetical protein [Euzebya rosea]|uniref:hypothetical protein n=1 Tax=Euzebya rosea TaxID=2052804 RepID=UPI000D3E03EB|nr:hypothetical protein [Euzebya rosea]